MCAYVIDIHIKPEFSTHITAEELAHVIRDTLNNQKQPDNTEITVVVTDDSEVKELNKRFRGIDSTTDVLSFSAHEGQEFITPEGTSNYLGDIVVSYPTAVAQAEEQGHSVAEEMALLIVHGCLHLLGYDHQTAQDHERMWAIQEQILSSLKSPHL